MTDRPNSHFHLHKRLPIPASPEPIQRYSGAQFDVYRYRLRNTTGQPQVLAEEMFGANDRVVAVSFFPKISVYPGESTDVLIMVGKGGTR